MEWNSTNFVTIIIANVNRREAEIALWYKVQKSTYINRYLVGGKFHHVQTSSVWLYVQLSYMERSKACFLKGKKKYDNIYWPFCKQRRAARSCPLQICA